LTILSQQPLANRRDSGTMLARVRSWYRPASTVKRKV